MTAAYYFFFGKPDAEYQKVNKTGIAVVNFLVRNIFENLSDNNSLSIIVNTNITFNPLYQETNKLQKFLPNKLPEN